MNRQLLPLLERALAIATDAHRGQRDKADTPYILHPLRVMAEVETVSEKIVALLHDVVEDSAWTLESLKKEGFPDEILTALDCVTKREGESYEDFIKRAAGNPIARRVKIADLEDNMDLRRIGSLTPEDVERMAKYKRAWELLRQP